MGRATYFAMIEVIADPSLWQAFPAPAAVHPRLKMLSPNTKTVVTAATLVGVLLASACSGPREPEKIGVEADLLKIEKDDANRKKAAAANKANAAKKKREKDPPPPERTN